MSNNNKSVRVTYSNETFAGGNHSATATAPDGRTGNGNGPTKGAARKAARAAALGQASAPVALTPELIKALELLLASQKGASVATSSEAEQASGSGEGPLDYTDDPVKYRAVRREAQRAVKEKHGKITDNKKFKDALDAEMVARGAAPWYGTRTRDEVVKVNSTTRRAVKKANRAKAKAA